MSQKGRYPSSFHQERLWFIDTFEIGTVYDHSPVYHNIPFIWKIEGPLHVQQLKESINLLISAHPILRTHITAVDEEAFQEITPSGHVELQVKQLESAPTSLEALYNRVTNDVTVSFDIQNDVLIRACLYRVDSGLSYLCLAVHHLIADTSSFRLIGSHWMNFYSRLSNGEALSHETGTTDESVYAKFSQWQKNLPPKLNTDLASFWNRKFSGKYTPLNLPADNPREQVHIYESDICFKKIDPTLVGGKQIRDKEAFWYAVLALLLSKISGNEQLIIGCHFDGRLLPETKKEIGPFDNVLPLFVDLTSVKTFEELQSNIQEDLLQSQQFAIYPYEKLSSDLKLNIDTSRIAIFDVIVGFEKVTPSTSLTSNLNVQEQRINLGLGKYDLNFLVSENDEGFNLQTTYNRLYYRKDSINHWMSILETIAAQVSKKSNSLLAELEALDTQGRKRLYQNSEEHHVSKITINAAFDQVVAKAGSRVAAVFQNEQITYNELDQASDRIAYYLAEEFNIKPNTLVAVIMEPGQNYLISIFGILKAGGVFVPIDQTYPEERKAYILKDSNAKHIITEREITLEGDYKVVNIKQALSNAKNTPVQKLGDPSSHKDFAYIIYTSGSTGKPKGCLISHFNLMNLIWNRQLDFGLTPDDVWVNAHSISFDFSIWEIFGAILTGAKLVIPSGNEVRDPYQFCNFIAVNQVSVLNQTPQSFYNLILAENTLTKHNLNAFLRLIIFGGDKLDFNKLKDWVAHYPLDKVPMVNMFGITETTVHTSYHFITNEDLVCGQSIIGKPIPGVQMHILDSAGKMQPEGIAGEIFVSGYGVSEGYLNQPELTHDKFPKTEAGIQQYKSGDLGLINRNGLYEYKGRIDNQVKIRGYRIELGEIEAALLQIKDITHAVVLVKQSGTTPTLSAFYISTNEAPVWQVKQLLRTKLPLHMIPKDIIKVKEFPLNQNNKLDKEALLKIKPAPAFVSTSNLSATEGKIFSVWKVVLEKESFGITENFFDCGGDSMLLVKVHKQLKNLLNTDLPLVKFYEYPTIKELGAYIDEQNLEKVIPPTKGPGASHLRKIAANFKK